jgi:hypothetical protein
MHLEVFVMNFVSLRKLFSCVAVSVGALLGISDTMVNAAVVFSENFESATAGANITTANTDFKTTITIGTGNTAHAVTDDGSIFASNNQYLSFADVSTTNGSSITLRRAFSTAPALTEINSGNFQFSFDFYDIPNATPAGFINTSIRVYLSNGIGTTAGNRAVDLQLYQDPDNQFGNVGLSVLSTGGTQVPAMAVSYFENTKYHVDIVGSLDPLGATYANGETVAFQTIDLWLDGVKVANDVAFRNNITQINDIVITAGNTSTNRVVSMNLDNIVLRTDITVVPEPSAIVLIGIGLIGSVLIAKRRNV